MTDSLDQLFVREQRPLWGLCDRMRRRRETHVGTFVPEPVADRHFAESAPLDASGEPPRAR